MLSPEALGLPPPPPSLAFRSISNYENELVGGTLTMPLDSQPLPVGEARLPSIQQGRDKARYILSMHHCHSSLPRLANWCVLRGFSAVVVMLRMTGPPSTLSSPKHLDLKRPPLEALLPSSSRGWSLTRGPRYADRLPAESPRLRSFLLRGCRSPAALRLHRPLGYFTG